MDHGKWAICNWNEIICLDLRKVSVIVKYTSFILNVQCM